jgi:hypothetical protein
MKQFSRISLSLLLCLFLLGSEASANWARLSVGGPEGRVIAIAADTYVIDVGISKGASVGNYYLVYEGGSDILDANGGVIGNYRIPAAVIKVRQVSTSESFCEVVSPSKGWVIQRGDGVMWISRASANVLKFATYRTTPNRPRLPGFRGRWIRVAPTVNPHSVIAQYYYPWTPPYNYGGGLPVSPGFYYFETPWLANHAPAAVVPNPVPPPPAPAYTPPPTAAPQAAPPQPQYPHPPNYWEIPEVDVNNVSDARLIRKFPLTQVEMQALEIQHRGAWDLYSKGYYPEAFNAFCQQALLYRGNYLSPYWAGACALKLGDGRLAVEWFKMALSINPNYQPALNAIKRESERERAQQPKPKTK